MWPELLPRDSVIRLRKIVRSFSLTNVRASGKSQVLVDCNERWRVHLTHSHTHVHFQKSPRGLWITKGESIGCRIKCPHYSPTPNPREPQSFACRPTGQKQNHWASFKKLLVAHTNFGCWAIHCHLWCLPTCKIVELKKSRPTSFSYPSHPWQHVTKDFITGLWPTPREFDCIAVIVDHLTKYVHFVPTTLK